MRGILQKGYTLVGDVEGNNRRPQNASAAQHIDVQNICDANQHKNQHLAANTTKAHLAGKRVVGNGAHYTCDIVDDHKGDQGIQQSIAVAQEVAQPTADSCKNQLDGVPECGEVCIL